MDKLEVKVDPTKIKVGDLMAFINYVKVVTVSSDGLDLETEDLTKDNKKIRIRGKDLVENSFSADLYSREEKVTKTEAAEILINSPNRPLTVCFKKQDKSERLLRGRFVKHEALLGRSMVEDLDLPADDSSDRLRQVDHRSILYLIVNQTKFVVK